MQSSEFAQSLDFSIKGVSAQNKEFGGPRQLDRAAAGSWQIADGGDPRTTRARVTSVGDLRVHFVVDKYMFLPYMYMCMHI